MARGSVRLRALQPTALVQFTRPTPTTTIERARARGLARKLVLGCTACECHKSQPDGRPPVPATMPRHADFVVVGEAPGGQEVKRGVVGAGPGSRLLRALMADVGIDGDRAAWMNTVSCHPNVDGKTRAPRKEEVLACRPNLVRQLEAAGSTFVLLVGAKAMGSWRGDVGVTAHHGEVFVWSDRWVVMGIIHPDAVLKGQGGFKKLIREDLARWRDVVYGGDDPLVWLGQKCVKCGGEARMWDRDGVPLCQQHWEMWGKAWEKERRKWGDRAAIQLSF